MNPVTNSIIVVTMVSLDWAKEASQTGRSAIVVEMGARRIFIADL